MPFHIHRDIETLWIMLGIVWFAAAFFGKRSARRQSASSRLFHIGLGGLAFVLMFTDYLRYGPLAWTFVPKTPLVADIGLGLTLAGIGFAIWARFFLGGNWSATVTVKQDHRLVRSGPYAIVRHPIYSGLLLALVGTAIAFRHAQGLAAVVVALITWRLKSRLEESFMREQFGEQYAQYQQEVKALIPFVW